MEVEPKKEWILHIISNTHWDREWYFSFERFRLRFVKLMDRLLDLLENQPAYQPFLMDGQYIPIQDYFEMRPGQRARVKQLVQAGRLQIGPWYTQPLETIASGEAMIRNLMLGIERSLELGGVTRIGYMVDEFGHVSQLPQICQGFSIEDIVIWRGVPRGMKSRFQWVGSDGSALQVFYSNAGYGEATALPCELEDFFEIVDWTPQHRSGLKNRIKALLELRTPKATTQHLLALNGIDHAYAQQDLVSIIEKAQDLIPGVRVLHSTIPDYIQTVKEAHARQEIPLQTHHGELLDSNEAVLKDIHSFRCDQKALNRQVESLLERWAEPFACLAWLAGNTYPQEELWKSWEYVLQNHSHDSLGCSSVDEVYRQVMGRYESAAGIASEIREESLQFLCRQIQLKASETEMQLVVFNPLSWARDEWVFATLDLPLALGIETFALFDREQEVPYTIFEQTDTFRVRFNPQRGHSTRTPVRQVKIGFWAASVPGIGYKSYKISGTRPVQKTFPALSPEPGMLENEFLRMKINPNGTYDLDDKTTGSVFRELGFFEDSGEAGDGYNHTRPEHDEIITSSSSQAEIRLIRDDGLHAEYQIALQLDLPEGLDSERTRRSDHRTPCKITQILTIHRFSRRVDIRVTIENQQRDHRLRLVFPTHLQSNFSWAAMPFEVVKRNIAVPDASEFEDEKPRPTHPQHHFVDVQDGKSGLVVANRGIYEYEVMDNAHRSIALTLLRCTDRLDSGSLGAVDEMKMPLGQEIGERSFQISLIPHADGWETAVREADAFAMPMEALIPRKLELEHLPGYRLPVIEPRLASEDGFIDLEPACLVITAVKKHQRDSAVVIRALNRSGQPVRARIQLKFPGKNFQQVWQANLAEDLLEQLRSTADGWVAAEIPGWGLWTTVWFLS
jgi:mannosylglycerate hydrolase